ncbi:hypothetical protein PR048_030829 [Dryococelus australis]|uniref:Uncharacterized protein n=1 Tax=Dryococelus australis TaxID=614101 RepID=A0ABQ9G9Z6_9NEOP|nr:hypothetical protein PR048_030829 [Dryococelus australis]
MKGNHARKHALRQRGIRQPWPAIGAMTTSLRLVHCQLGSVVAERIACSPPTKANRVQSSTGSLPDFCNREIVLLVGGFSRGSPDFPRPCIPALLHSHLASVNRSKRQFLECMECCEVSSATPIEEIQHSCIFIPCGRVKQGNEFCLWQLQPVDKRLLLATVFDALNIVLRNEAEHVNTGLPAGAAFYQPLTRGCSRYHVVSANARFPADATPGFSHVGIVADDAAGRHVSGGISHLLHPCILILLLTHLVFTLIGSQGLDELRGGGDGKQKTLLKPHTTSNCDKRRTRGPVDRNPIKQPASVCKGPVLRKPPVSLLAYHQGDPGSIPGRVTPDFPRWSAGLLGDLPFPHPYIPALLHTHIDHPHRLSRPRCHEPPKSLHSLDLVLQPGSSPHEGTPQWLIVLTRVWAHLIALDETFGGRWSLGSPLVDDRPIMNAVKYRVVTGVLWTSRTMVSSNIDTNRTETGDPREYPPTNGIVRHDSYLRKSEVNRPGIEPGSPWWEASRITAQPPRPHVSYTRLHQHLPRSKIESSWFPTSIQLDLGSNVNVLHQRNFMILNLRFVDLGSKVRDRD